MTATAHDRGHPIYWDGADWRYSDTGRIINHKRPCVRCGRPPTPEGYDACLGFIPGVSSACCGHGVAERIINIEAGKEDAK